MRLLRDHQTWPVARDQDSWIRAGISFFEKDEEKEANLSPPVWPRGIGMI